MRHLLRTLKAALAWVAASLVLPTSAHALRADDGGELLAAFNDVVTVDVRPIAVPEPASLALLGPGIAGLAATLRRKG
jgi:hypothetical protein